MVDAVSADPAVAAALTVVNNEVRSSVSRSLMLEVLLVTEVPEPRAGKCNGYATTSWSYRTTSAGRAVLLRSTGLGILLPGTVMGAAVFIFSSVYRQKNWPAGPLTFFLFQGNRRGRSRVARQQIGYLRVPKNGCSERDKEEQSRQFTRAEWNRRQERWFVNPQATPG